MASKQRSGVAAYVGVPEPEKIASAKRYVPLVAIPPRLASEIDASVGVLRSLNLVPAWFDRSDFVRCAAVALARNDVGVYLVGGGALRQGFLKILSAIEEMESGG